MIQKKMRIYRDSFAIIVLTAVVIAVMYGITNQRQQFSRTSVEILEESSLLKKPEDHLMSTSDRRISSNFVLEDNQTTAQDMKSVRTNDVTTVHGAGHQRHLEEVDYTALKCPEYKSVPGYNLPKIALASFPRSGNGWTRLLIQYTTGLYVGSVYWKKATHKNMDIFKATGNDVQNGSVVIIKTHLQPTAKLSNEAVLLIKNPYKSIVSSVYHTIFLRKKFSKNDMIRYFKTDEWKEEFSVCALAWKNTNLQWIDGSKRLLVVQYEKLLKNTETELARIIDFIHQPVDKQRLRCAVKTYYPTASSTRFFMDPYTDKMRNVLDSYIKDVNETLIRFSHEPLPTYQRISSY